MAELRPDKMGGSVDLFTDNTAAIDIIKAHGVTARTKHFERWISYVRDLYQRHIIKLNHLATDDMPADIFTKALGPAKFKQFRATLLNV